MNTLRDAIRNKDFVVTADLALSPSATADEIVAAASALQPHVDALQILDDREAVGHMSSPQSRHVPALMSRFTSLPGIGTALPCRRRFWVQLRLA